MSFALNPYRHVAAGGFSPLDITGLELWLDATDGATITETLGKVTAWSDKSAAGNDLNVFFGSNEAIIDSAAINGLDVVKFNTNHAARTSSAPFDPSEGFSFFTVRVAHYVGDYDHIMNTYDGSTRIDWVHAPYSNTSSYCSWRPSLRTNPEVTINVEMVAGIVENGTSCKFYNNGTQKVNWTGGIVPSALGVELCLNAPHPSFSSNSYGEVLLYNSAVSDTDREAIEDYLGAKWGITITH